ncbi:MAG: tetratricopeptide repeat protein, partial [Bacteroidota bacterium]
MLFFCFLSIAWLNSNAQTDFPALKQQFLDYRKADQQDSALFIARKMNTLALKEQTDTSFWYALSMRYQGVVFFDKGNNEKALDLLNSSLLLFQEYHFQSSDFLYALYLNGIISSIMMDYQKAKKYLIDAIDLYEQRKLIDGIEYLNCMQELGIVYCSIGEYTQAEFIIRKNLNIATNLYGENNEVTGNLYNGLGNLFSEIGNYTDAIDCYSRALNIYTEINSNWQYIANTHQNLGIAFSETSEFKKAKEHYDRAIYLYESKNEIGQLEYLNATTLLGIYYYETGLIDMAFEKLSVALNGFDTYFPNLQYEKIYALQAIFMVFMEKKEYKNAFNSLLNSEAIIKLYGSEIGPLNVASHYRLKGRYYREMGDFNQAIKAFKKGADLIVKYLGSESSILISYLEDLGLGYYELGEFHESKKYFSQAMHISEVSDAVIEPSLFIDFGLVYFEENFKDSAEYYYKKSIEVAKKNNDLTSCPVAYNNLGYLRQIQGDFKEAEVYFLESINLHKVYSSSSDYEYRRTLNNLSKLYASSLDYKKEFDYLELSLQFNTINLKNNFTSLSSVEQFSYWKQEIEFYDDMNSFSVSAVDSVPSSTQLSYNGNLISKSLLLETSRELDQAVSQSSDEEMMAQFTEMKQLRKL